MKNTSGRPGDEVIEAYVKTPQAGGPIHALVGFQRVHLEAGESRDVTLILDPRSVSSVDDQGQRSILAGSYHLSIGGAQPGETAAKAEANFSIVGTLPLPK